jgi:hypothetical protein
MACLLFSENIVCFSDRNSFLRALGILFKNARLRYRVHKHEIDICINQINVVPKAWNKRLILKEVVMADIFKIQYSNILYSLSVLRYHLRSDSVYGGYHFNAKPAVSRTCFRIDLVSCKLKVLHKTQSLKYLRIKWVKAEMISPYTESSWKCIPHWKAEQCRRTLTRWT